MDQGTFTQYIEVTSGTIQIALQGQYQVSNLLCKVDEWKKKYPEDLFMY